LERPTPRPRVSRHGLRELAQRRTDQDSSGADMAGSSLALLEDHMALPERELQPTVHDAIVDTMRAWLREIGGARLTDTINWQLVLSAVKEPLKQAGGCRILIPAFSTVPAYETLFVIHPDRRAVPVTALEGFTTRLDARLRAIPALADLRVFE